ncbi:MAG: glycine--tRNA ligase [Chlamydiales bacterium]
MTHSITENPPDMEEIVSLCKRRGFIFQSSEIYGGLQGIYDYGPLGVEIKNSLRAAWWRSMVYERNDIEGIDSAILTHALTLQHSGHTETFTDAMVDCRDCKHRMRVDSVHNGKCENCGSENLTSTRQFNLMLRTNLGPIENDSFAYLRPETAQGIFTNFMNVLTTSARKIPFGIAQVGKAFRNEITPKNFIFRTREFEQLELEFFVQPGTDDEWYKRWIDIRLEWWKKQGIREKNLQLQEQTPEELAHYSKATTDILYRFPQGLAELEGIANRTDFDLGSHTKSQDIFEIHAKVSPNPHSVTALGVQDLGTKERYIPFVIEPSAGLDRGVLAILIDSYRKEQLSSGDARIVLHIAPHLAPFKAAIIPLAKNNTDIVNTAKRIHSDLQQLGLGRIRYEDTGNVGKAYRRNDEIGTPICITVDFDTFNDTSVTVRDRNSMKQKRVSISELPNIIRNFFF